MSPMNAATGSSGSAWTPHRQGEGGGFRISVWKKRDGGGWQDMSGNDIRAEQGHAAAVKGATGLPLVSLTLGTDGALSSRSWEKTEPRVYQRRWCSTLPLAGEQLAVRYANFLTPRPKPNRKLLRTVSAWGEDAQADLARLHVGVVGAGSVGGIVAEALARTGIVRVTIIDFDIVALVNLDRLLHATSRDASLCGWGQKMTLTLGPL